MSLPSAPPAVPIPDQGPRPVALGASAPGTSITTSW